MSEPTISDRKAELRARMGNYDGGDPDDFHRFFEAVDAHLPELLDDHGRLERALRQLIIAAKDQRSLLVCYRTGKRPSQAMLDRMLGPDGPTSSIAGAERALGIRDEAGGG